MTTRSSQFRTRSGMFCALLIGIAALASASRLDARVTQINITCGPVPTFGGASFGTVGTYELIQGTITGEVDPLNPQNAVIVDLENAPRNPNGTVSYSADFQIIRPTDLSKGNHKVILDFPNRGNATALSSYNGGTANTKAWCPTWPSTATVGNGFLMNQGYTVVEGVWDITGPSPTTLFGVSFPVATNGGTPITGPALEELVVDIWPTPVATLPLTYPPASTTAAATLTVRENYQDSPNLVPACGSGAGSGVCWAYTTSAPVSRAPGNTSLNPMGYAVGLMSGGMEINFGAPGTYAPTALYEFTYVATNPVVAGLGFASVRDLATFLRSAQTDDNGVANPLAGDVQAIYTTSSSESSRFARDFVTLGFNEAEQSKGGKGVKVVDGVINTVAGADGIYLNYRFSQPFRTTRQHITRWTPEGQFPWADISSHDHVTRQTAGRLDACLKTGTCPKIFEINTENEYYSKVTSLLTTDTEGKDLNLKDTPNANARYYLMSSLPHGAGSATTTGICQQYENPLAADAVVRALLVDMDEWVTNGTQPPDNRVPTRADGTLVPSLPQSGVGFPNIPISGVTGTGPSGTGTSAFYDGLMHTGDLPYFGPEFSEGILTILPPTITSPYPVFVPKTDADGNDIAGIRLPDISVPLATYTGWGLRAFHSGDPVPIYDSCDGLSLGSNIGVGQVIPFLQTQAERIAAGDPRPSIAERYPTKAAYVNLVTEAAQQLGAERLLLDMDVQAYSSWAGTSGPSPSGGIGW